MHTDTPQCNRIHSIILAHKLPGMFTEQNRNSSQLVRKLHISYCSTIKSNLYGAAIMTCEFENTKKYFLIAEDPRSKATLEIAHKAAKTNATVLITGETGVGKELLAQYIHHYSTFANGPFISVNCAAMPENMIESMLFGYEKGAFTNAINQYPGKFEQAQNGSLLLDEISEIPLGLQAKLLRVLQEREIERLGGKNLIAINVRIIAATNRDLQQQVAAGTFRSDLYYRLNVLPIHCAALRARPLDILPMTHYLLEKHSATLQRKTPLLTNNAQNKLVNYSWPGNIREMDNVIQRTLIMNGNEILDSDDFELLDQTEDEINNNTLHNGVDLLNSKLKITEAKLILDVLKEAEGSRDIAAKKLKISPRTLRYKISKLKSVGLKVP